MSLVVTAVSASLALFLLTGGGGLLTTPIFGLSRCSDFVRDRIFLIMLASIGLLLEGGMLYLSGHTRLARATALAGGVLAASSFANLGLDQDPAAAWLNWRVRRLEFDPNWSCRPIANHEHVFYDELEDRYEAGGPGVAIAPRD